MNKLGLVILGLIFGATAFMIGFMTYNLLWDSIKLITILVR
ncbi:hypothetical protein SUSAZ_09480 [Sulfolobus acidocaldarius SUSAZ]|nr:hypothetical protein SUSAZ_09480 [Sulfolobus acidocaldarius SUSAZ]